MMDPKNLMFKSQSPVHTESPVHTDPMLDHATTPATTVAKEKATKEEKHKRIADLNVEIESKQKEYDAAVKKSEGDKAEFAANEVKKLDSKKQELDKLKGELHQLVEETKVESRHAKILREHGGLESNIPLNHEYWRIRP